MPPGINHKGRYKTMKKIDITVNNKTYTFICEWHDTRSGFAHDCTLFINDSEVTTAHCYYINRTWERWSYQSVCVEAINNLIAWLKEHITSGFKEANNYKRLTPARREICNELIDNNPYIKEYKACKQLLLDNLY